MVFVARWGGICSEVGSICSEVRSWIWEMFDPSLTREIILGLIIPGYI